MLAKLFAGHWSQSPVRFGQDHEPICACVMPSQDTLRPGQLAKESYPLTLSGPLAVSEQRKRHCSSCQPEMNLGFEFTMAFQPIVDVSQGRIFAQEALVRGLNEEPAGLILCQINEQNLYQFDQLCRVKALQWAAMLEIDGYLSINFLPNAVYQPETCIRVTLDAAEQFGFPSDRIIFEFTENEKIFDHNHLKNIIQTYQRLGFKTAIDDFGSGYSGLNLLAEFQPDIIKIDMKLVRGIDQNKVKQSILGAMLEVCRDLGIVMIAEGIETLEEAITLQAMGITLMQGFYIATPAFQSLAVPRLSLQ